MKLSHARALANPHSFKITYYYTATPSGLVISFPSLSQHGTVPPDANFSTFSAVLHLSENWLPISQNCRIGSEGSGGIIFASLRSYVCGMVKNNVVSNGEYTHCESFKHPSCTPPFWALVCVLWNIHVSYNLVDTLAGRYHPN